MVEPVCETAIGLVAEKQVCHDKLSVRMPSSPNGSSGWRTTGRTCEQLDAKRSCSWTTALGDASAVALALLDGNVESRSEAWFGFTEQRGQ